MGSANFGNLYPQTPLFRNGSSLCSLAFDDVQNIFGEPGANLGSMNIDELLRNIWTAEESQAMTAAMNPVEGLSRGLSTQFSLQKQGSLCLPRTVSAKLVEDVWKTTLPQQGNTEGLSAGVNHQRQISLEDFLAKAGVVKEGPPRVEVTLEDFLVKTGIVTERQPSNQVSSNKVLMASGNQAPSDQVQQVPSNQRVPTNQFSPNQIRQASPIQTSMPSNQMQQQMPPIPVHRHATPLHSSPVHQHAPPNQAFMGFGGFTVPRNDGGLEKKNGQAAPSALNGFNPTATNGLSCPPPSGKTRLDALNSMFLPGQQGDWMNNPYGKSSTHQNQIVQRQAIAEAASALGSVSNASNGPCPQSSPGRLSPVGGGLGAVLGTGGLGTSLGGNACPTRISFGPCSPLSPEFDEGSPGTSNLPLSLISEFGNGQPQKKKRNTEPPVERVIERRQRRMIKNRESAARSRARKQAYTVELEAEVSQLKEENMELLKKQEKEAASRKKQILALMPLTPEIGHKGHCLKRTHTGPW